LGRFYQAIGNRPGLAFFIWLALTTAENSSNLLNGGNLTNGVTPASEVCAGVGKFFCQGSFQTFIIYHRPVNGRPDGGPIHGRCGREHCGERVSVAKKSLATPASGLALGARGVKN